MSGAFLKKFGRISVVSKKNLLSHIFLSCATSPNYESEQDPRKRPNQPVLAQTPGLCVCAYVRARASSRLSYVSHSPVHKYLNFSLQVKLTIIYISLT